MDCDGKKKLMRAKERDSRRGTETTNAVDVKKRSGRLPHVLDINKIQQLK